MTDYSKWDAYASQLSDDDSGDERTAALRAQLAREDVWEAVEGAEIVDDDTDPSSTPEARGEGGIEGADAAPAGAHAGSEAAEGGGRQPGPVSNAAMATQRRRARSSGDMEGTFLQEVDGSGDEGEHGAARAGAGSAAAADGSGASESEHDDSSSVGGGSDDTLRDPDDEPTEEELAARAIAEAAGVDGSLAERQGMLLEAVDETAEGESGDGGDEGAPGAESSGATGTSRSDAPPPPRVEAVSPLPTLPRGAADRGFDSLRWQPSGPFDDDLYVPLISRTLVATSGCSAIGCRRGRNMCEGMDVGEVSRATAASVSVLLLNCVDIRDVLTTVADNAARLPKTGGELGDETAKTQLVFTICNKDMGTLARCIVLLVLASEPLPPGSSEEPLNIDVAYASFVLCVWGSLGLTQAQRHRLDAVLDMLVEASTDPSTFATHPRTKFCAVNDDELPMLRRFWSEWRSCEISVASVEESRTKHVRACLADVHGGELGDGGGPDATESGKEDIIAVALRNREWMSLYVDCSGAAHELSVMGKSGSIALPSGLPTYVPPAVAVGGVDETAAAAAAAKSEWSHDGDDFGSDRVPNPTLLSLVHASRTAMEPLHLEWRLPYASCIYLALRPSAQDRVAAMRRASGGEDRLFDPVLEMLLRQLAVFRRCVAAGAINFRVQQGNPAQPTFRRSLRRPFNRIDTGLLGDRVGLLNIVSACGPLMDSTVPAANALLYVTTRRWRGQTTERGAPRSFEDFLNENLAVPVDVMPSVLGVRWINAGHLLTEYGGASPRDEWWTDVEYAESGAQAPSSVACTFAFAPVFTTRQALLPFTKLPLRWLDDEAAAERLLMGGDDDDGGQPAVIGCLRQVARQALNVKLGALRHVSAKEADEMDPPSISISTLLHVVTRASAQLCGVTGLLERLLRPLPPHFVRPHLMEINAQANLVPEALRPVVDLSRFGENAGSVEAGGFAGWDGIGELSGVVAMTMRLHDSLTTDFGAGLLSGEYAGGIDAWFSTTDDVPTRESLRHTGASGQDRTAAALSHQLRQWMGFYARAGHVHVVSNVAIRANGVLVRVLLPEKFASAVLEGTSFCAVVLLDHYTMKPLSWPVRIDGAENAAAVGLELQRIANPAVGGTGSLSSAEEQPTKLCSVEYGETGSCPATDPGELVTSFKDHGKHYSAEIAFPPSVPETVTPVVRYLSPASVEYYFPPPAAGAAADGAAASDGGGGGGGAGGTADVDDPSCVAHLHLPWPIARKRVKTKISRKRRVLLPKLPKQLAPSCFRTFNVAELPPWPPELRFDAAPFDLGRRMFSVAELAVSHASADGLAFGHDPFLDVRQTLVAMFNVAQDDMDAVHVVVSDTNSVRFTCFIERVCEAANGEPVLHISYFKRVDGDGKTAEGARRLEDALRGGKERGCNELTGSEAELELFSKIIERNAKMISQPKPLETRDHGLDLTGVPLRHAFLTPLYPVFALETNIASVRRYASETMQRAGAAGSGGAGDGDLSAAADAVNARLGKTGCAACGKQKPDLLVCSRCKAAKFCDKTCQRKAWKGHKRQCKMMAALARR